MLRAAFVLATTLLPALLHASEGAEHGDPDAALKLLGYAVINFTLFAGLLYWKLKDPVKNAISERYSYIVDQVSAVEKERAKLTTALNEAKQLVAQVEAEKQQLIEQVVSAAKHQATQMVATAEKSALASNNGAQQQAAALEREALASLIRTAADLLTSKASNGIEQKIDAAGSQSLCTQALKQIEGH